MTRWGEIKCPRCEDHDTAFMNLHREYDRRGDTIAELEAKLATCEKYRDAYAECDRIGAQAVRDLEAKLRKSALQEMSALGQASEAYQAQLAAEAKLAKLRTFLDELWDSQGYDARELHDLLKDLDGVSDE